MWNFAFAIYRWREHFLPIIATPAAQPLQTTNWYTKIDKFGVLLSSEILFVVSIAAMMALRARRRPRRLKVRPL
jgi:hypothetical protein